MIELRWIQRPRQVKQFLGAETVLQYRTWKVRLDASGAITPLPLPLEWTDWVSVEPPKLAEPRRDPLGGDKQP